jgi:hypothetical protein
MSYMRVIYSFICMARTKVLLKVLMIACKYIANREIYPTRRQCCVIQRETFIGVYEKELRENKYNLTHSL